MKNKDGASDAEILQNAISAIKTVNDIALQNELLSIMVLLAQDRNKFSASLLLSVIKKEDIMSSELLEILTKEIVEEAEAKTEAKTRRIDLKVIQMLGSSSIEDIGKAIGASKDKVRTVAAEWMLESGKPIADIIAATGWTASKIKSIQIEMMLCDGILPADISKNIKASLKKVLKVQTDLKDKGVLK